MAYRPLNLERKTVSSPAPEFGSHSFNPHLANQFKISEPFENSRTTATDSSLSASLVKPISLESRNLMKAMEGVNTKNFISRNPQNLRGSVEFNPLNYSFVPPNTTERFSEPNYFIDHKEQKAEVENRKHVSKTFSFKTANPQNPLRLFPKSVIMKSMKKIQPTLEDLLKPGSIKLSQMSRLKIKNLIYAFLPLEDIFQLCILFDTKPPITFLNDPLRDDFVIKRILDGLCKEDFSYVYCKLRGGSGFQEIPSYEELSSKYLESDKMIEADVKRTSSQYMDMIPYLKYPQFTQQAQSDGRLNARIARVRSHEHLALLSRIRSDR